MRWVDPMGLALSAEPVVRDGLAGLPVDCRRTDGACRDMPGRCSDRRPGGIRQLSQRGKRVGWSAAARTTRRWPERIARKSGRWISVGPTGDVGCGQRVRCPAGGGRPAGSWRIQQKPRMGMEYLRRITDRQPVPTVRIAGRSPEHEARRGPVDAGSDFPPVILRRCRRCAGQPGDQQHRLAQPADGNSSTDCPGAHGCVSASCRRRSAIARTRSRNWPCWLRTLVFWLAHAWLVWGNRDSLLKYARCGSGGRNIHGRNWAITGAFARFVPHKWSNTYAPVGRYRRAHAKTSHHNCASR